MTETLAIQASPYQGSSFNRCDRCKNFTRPAFQIHLGRFDYRYYCSEDCLPTAIRSKGETTIRAIQSKRQRGTIRDRAMRARGDRISKQQFLELLQDGPLGLPALMQRSGFSRRYMKFLLTGLLKSGELLRMSAYGSGRFPFFALPTDANELEDLRSGFVTQKPLTENQLAIVDFLRGQPRSLTEVKDRFSSTPQAAWSALKRLRQRGVIISAEISHASHWALAEEQTILDRMVAANLSENQSKLIEFLKANSGCQQKQIVEALNMGRTSFRYAMRDLLDRGLIRLESKHRYKSYFLIDGAIDNV